MPPATRTAAKKPLHAAAIRASLIAEVRRREGVSRVELARRLGIAPSTVGLHVERLKEEGYLREGGKREAGPGRPAVEVRLDPAAGAFIGVDFEARQILATAVDFSLDTRRQVRCTLGAGDTAPAVCEKIRRTIRDLSHGRRLLAVGVGVPGTVDPESGVARHYEHIRGWRDVALADQLSGDLKVPVFLENNIRAMALAEQEFGAGRGLGNFVTLGVRSGISMGIIIDGRLYRGHGGVAGEIGGWPSSADRSMTLEQQSGVKAMLATANERIQREGVTDLPLRRGRLTPAAFLKHARAGHPLLVEICRQAAEGIGQAIARASLLLDPQLVILAGPLVQLGDIFLEVVRTTAARSTPETHGRVPCIQLSELGDHAGALGAAALAVHRWQLDT